MEERNKGIYPNKDAGNGYKMCGMSTLVCDPWNFGQILWLESGFFGIKK